MLYLLIYGSNLSPLPAILIGIKRFVRSELPTVSKIIWLLVIVSFVSDISSLVMAIHFGHNYLIINAYSIVELIFVGVIISEIVANRFYIVLYSILAILFIFINAVSGFNDYHGSFLAVTALISILICFLTLKFYYQNETDIFIESFSGFWYVIGLLTYFSGALFTFILSEDILSQEEIVIEYSWAFHNIANILKNILFAIGLWKARAVA
ncbi:hypothetical protein [Marinoscillum furvescens]|uniref:YhhN-like protein n=1 Tax=Marinoscillum furvescens DSM 4134 TaxID=1122208 RepID=A0A3D9LH96_MARFU|nr:hypothetical protein [Marinoscillum furvescens]REE05864.1 hypothetical protein C7460_101383 [Marinoscillum furvescens DSM 4134]